MQHMQSESLCAYWRLRIRIRIRMGPKRAESLSEFSFSRLAISGGLEGNRLAKSPPAQRAVGCPAAIAVVAG